MPNGAPAFLVANLFFTCVAEEAFFRPDPGTADAASPTAQAASLDVDRDRRLAALFGLAHAGGGVMWMLVATLAGFGYAAVYARTRTIEGAILVHFAVNAVHFLFFTYPALAG